MRTFVAFLRAFARAYTYNVRTNSYLWLGVFWGMLVPFFTLAFDANVLSSAGRGPLEVVRLFPAHFLLLAHPLILGVLFGAMGTVRHDLETENGRLVKTLEELAMTDPLTGLYNMRYVKEALKNMVESTRRSQKLLSIVLIDLDGFKAVNDEHGHLRGDRVLCAAASALRSALRQSDILGRYGGDEFILLDPAGRQSAVLLVERALKAVRGATGLSFSAGIACWPEDGKTPEELIAAADERLGIIKKRGHESQHSLRAIPAPGPTARVPAHESVR